MVSTLQPTHAPTESPVSSLCSFTRNSHRYRAAKKAAKDLEAAGGMMMDAIEEEPAAVSKKGATRKTRGAAALKATTLKVGLYRGCTS